MLIEVLPEDLDISVAAQLARADLDDAGLMLDQWGNPGSGMDSGGQYFVC